MVVGATVAGPRHRPRPAVLRRRMSPQLGALTAICIGMNLLESVLDVTIGPAGSVGLVSQASAVVPFGTFHDLRWISVYHNSWPMLLVEVVAMLAVRGPLVGICVALAWPAGSPRPPWGRLIARGVCATAVASCILAPSVAVLFELAIVPVSWLFLAAVPTALLVALIIHPVGITAGWWRQAIPLHSLAWVVAAFVVASLAALACGPAPLPLVPVIASVAGVFNAWAWAGLVRASVCRPPSRFAPVVPLAFLVLVGLVIGGTDLGFAGASSPSAAVRGTRAAQSHRGTPLIIVSGYGSKWAGQSVHPIPGPFHEQQFSYRGLDRSGQPLPYRPVDTAKPLPRLDDLLAAQVGALHRAAGQDVDLVADSEGALVAESFVHQDPEAPVSVLVEASPLVGVSRVTYPPDGTSGWGFATRDLISGLGRSFQGVAPVDLSPSNPFLISVDLATPAARFDLACPLGNIRQVALLPLADAVASPTVPDMAFPTAVVPAFHSGLLGSPGGRRLVARALQNGTVPANPTWSVLDSAIRWAASAWQVPSLGVGRPTDRSCNEVGGPSPD